MTEAGVKEIGAATINMEEGKLKNATANTVISYTASGTDFTLEESVATMDATYYSAYTDKDTNTQLNTTKSFEVYKNSALVDPLTKLYVGVSQSDWDTAAKNNPGTYTATVTYNFSAGEVAVSAITVDSILPEVLEDGKWSNKPGEIPVSNLVLDRVEYKDLSAVGSYAVHIPLTATLTQAGDGIYTCTDSGVTWTFTMDGDALIKVTVSGAEGNYAELNGDYIYYGH